jgi:hypothetical protein
LEDILASPPDPLSNQLYQLKVIIHLIGEGESVLRGANAPLGETTPFKIESHFTSRFLCLAGEGMKGMGEVKIA